MVLAGGAGRRLGGADKPTLTVAGQSMLTRVLAAVHDADPRIVVGRVPPDLPVHVHSTSEEPPGGGPVAAASAGLTLVPDALVGHCWPAVFSVIGSAATEDGFPVVEGLLSLVHLDHGASLA